MAGFATLASYCFWKIRELEASRGPVLYELATDPPGTHRLALKKVGASTGLSGRLVRKDDRRTPSAATLLEVRSAKWSVPWQEVHLHEVDCGCAVRDVLFNLEDEDSSAVSYEVTDASRAMLASATLEVRCSLHFRENINIGGFVLRGFLAAYLVGLLLAATGAALQRRKLRAPKPPALTSPS